MFGIRYSWKSARAPKTVEDWCIELRVSIEVDTGLNLCGTREPLMSAMTSGAVEYKCLQLGESREVETGRKCLASEILEVCKGVRDSHRPAHELEKFPRGFN